MKQSKINKQVSRNLQEALALQVQEHIEQSHPELRGAVVEISPCGTFASVRKVPKSDPQ